MLKMFSDYRLANSPVHYFAKERRDNMKIPPELFQSVCFIFISKNEEMLPIGSACVIGVKESSHTFSYIVTAKHVIAAIKNHSKEGKVYIRMDFKGGDVFFVESFVEEWSAHPEDTSVDASVLPFIKPLIKKWGAPFSVSSKTCVTKEDLKKNICIGEDIFMLGLFHHHYGEKTNETVVRAGTLMMTPKQKIKTNSFGDMEAYLIESRSIGGLSGSPVFVYNASDLQWDGKVGLQSIYWLGLIHGHWDVFGQQTDDLIEDMVGEKINTGVSIVTPALKVMEIINQPKFVEERKRIIEKSINYPVEDAWKSP